MSDVNIYDIDLDQTPANYTPLSPLSYIRRTAAVYPDVTSVIHGKRRYTWAETYARCKRLGSAPAKKPPWLAREHGLEASRKLLSELKHVCTVAEASDEYDGFVRWLDELCGLHGPAPTVLTRSAAQLLGVSEDPRQSAGLRPPMVELLAPAISAYAGLDAALTRELLTHAARRSNSGA